MLFLSIGSSLNAVHASPVSAPSTPAVIGTALPPASGACRVAPQRDGRTHDGERDGRRVRHSELAPRSSAMATVIVAIAGTVPGPRFPDIRLLL
jgi:hypothetical protein